MIFKKKWLILDIFQQKTQKFRKNIEKMTKK
jgi:hypothetical protein